MEEVVGNEDVAKLEGLTVLHEPRAQHLDQVDVRQTDGECGERTRHEQPVARSGICTDKHYKIQTYGVEDLLHEPRGELYNIKPRSKEDKLDIDSSSDY